MNILKKCRRAALKLFDFARKALGTWKRKGFRAMRTQIVNKVKLHTASYGKRFLFAIDEERRKAEEEYVFVDNFKISVIVPLYNTPVKYLNEMIKSVLDGTYKNVELCLADGSDAEHADTGVCAREWAHKDSRVVYEKLEKNLGISENTNAALKLAAGDYIALLDHDDLLHPSALFEVEKAAEDGADFIYTDEATFVNGDVSDLSSANLKPDFAPDTLRSYNYICHLTAFSRSLYEKVGGFRSECDGSQDYDMILRLTEKAEKIVHIPEVLYFWRGHANSTAQDITSKPYIVKAAHKALSDHLERTGLKGEVCDSLIVSTYRIKYAVAGEPKVSVIIPNKDNVDILSRCIDSLYRCTYKNFEIIIVENNSTEDKTFDYYREITAKHENIILAEYGGGFNFSAINNFGFGYCSGECILLLNNDTEVISPDFFESMLMYALRRDVGAVGAMLYYPDNTVQHAGIVLGVGGVGAHAFAGLPRGAYGYMSRAAIAQNYSAVTAACLMLRREVYEEIGGLDEGFEVAFNDVDLCMRLREKGYLNVFTPYAELYHYESKSRGKENTPEKAARFNSEILRFQTRWHRELEDGDPYYNRNFTLNSEPFRLRAPGEEIAWI